MRMRSAYKKVMGYLRVLALNDGSEIPKLNRGVDVLLESEASA